MTEPLPALDAERELDCLLMIGAAAGKLAHQVNNPLGTIHNAFLLVKDAIPGDHPHFRYVAAIEANIQRIAAATQRFVDVYDPERDRAINVPVSSIVAGAVQWMVATGRAPATRFAMDNRVHRLLPAPAGLLRHALLSLLDVALRALPDDQPLLISATLMHDEFELVLDGAGARVPEQADLHYPERLIAAMGGSLRGTVRDRGPELMVITLPVAQDTESS